jgi:glycosyltransferase involved in cell wall biosynthesis
MRSLMVSPTYQEAAGIEAFVERFGAARADFELLIVDDGSPDGTGAIVQRLAETRPWLHLLSRSGKGGLGSAYRAGFAWALERDYELIGQIDADGQHPPESLVALRARLEAEGADVLIGSRYVVGGDTGDWPAYRRAMSGVAGWTTRRATGLRQRDLSGGFKLWRASALRAIDVATTNAQGYGFQIETTMRAHRAGLSIIEEPISFGVRMQGESKLSSDVVVEGAKLLVTLRRDPWSPTTPTE